ncbi:hypothetical protein N7539_003248 [Penicillium diatomitis]|uniref:Restriction endonuclease domain-containing protein n=1 Tax=Penicillium diatomitis TaxID=2819901 RepID=A0A9X0BZH5_9EURO|nr:uncharacterized protein N7539_003248 [Penicillium diatomitis]KAJ5491681.1 hypothetical protein N7539_003248 [Penicillium diatomitis]
MEEPEFDCFDVECEREATGSSIKAIRAILDTIRAKPGLVTAYVKFTNVPPDIAKQKFRKGCRQLYDAVTQLLIVTVPGLAHDTAVGKFTWFFTTCCQRAGIELVIPTSSARVYEGQSCKEPDCSWYPEDTPVDRNTTWPSVILEVGLSESTRKLRADAAWWLAKSAGQVNVVILISINCAVAEITFESVVLEQPPIYLRGGRRQYRLQTRQSITVTRPPGGASQPVTTVPSTLPFTITFEEIMRRSPIPPEADMAIPIAALEGIARNVWKAQGL